MRADRPSSPRFRWNLAPLAAACLLAGCGGETGTATLAPAGTGTTPATPKQQSHARMVKALQEIATWAAADHPYHGDRAAKELWKQLAEQGDKAPWKLRLDAAQAHLRLGSTREGIAVLSRANELLRDGAIAGDRAAQNSVRFYLGMAWLRLAESENCCASPTPESCIMPLQGGALHAQKEGSTNAIPCFLEVIDNTEKGDYWHLGALWLLNLAHMTLGTWPDGVPAAHRLPESAVKSAKDFPKFANVAERVGLDTFDMLGGVIVDDFDGDEDLDMICSLWSATGQLRFYRNEGDGTFRDRTEAAGLLGITGGINMFQADYDNDGDLDFVVLRGAWLYNGGRHPNSLLQNQGDGTFVDVTFLSGLAEVNYPTSTADWGDYDNDGDLDLFVGNETSPKIQAPCQLFRNNGDGTFLDVAERAGVQNFGYTKGVSWGDYDGDGKLDLSVSNLHDENRLYHNLGDGRFEDVAGKLGMKKPIESFGTWFWDYDNDGNLDLFVAAYSTGIGDIAAHHLGLPKPHPETMRLWRGDGRGGFTDVTAQAGLTYPALPMGANFGDLDNDGFLDFHLGTGDPYYYSLMPNLMWHNEAGKRFVDVSMAGGFAHLQKGHGITFADLDADGDQDVYVVMGGAYPGDAAHNALFENPGFGNRWLAVHLVGAAGNRSAIGARLRAVIVEGQQERSVFRHVNSGGCFGANPLRQTLGLGRAESIKALEITWPGTGKVQTVTGLPFDRVVRIVEGKDGFALVETKQVVLGGK